MMRWLCFAVVALSGLLLTAGCTRRPKDVLSESEMVDLLVDLELAQAYNATSGGAHPGGSANAVMEAVLEKHGVTQEQMDSTTAYYGRNIDEYYLLYQKVGKKLAERSGRAADNVIEDDIWPYSRFTALLSGQQGEGIVFSFPADNLKPGESIDWSMRLTSNAGAELMLGVEYDNGQNSIVKKNAGTGNSIDVSLITDTAFAVKRVYGSMSVPRSSFPIWADSIRLLKRDYDSIEYRRIRMQKRIYPPRIKPIEITDTAPSDTAKVS